MISGTFGQGVVGGNTELLLQSYLGLCLDRAARVELILLELHRRCQRARGFYGLLARRFGFAKECCIYNLAQRSTKTETLRFQDILRRGELAVHHIHVIFLMLGVTKSRQGYS